MRGDRAGILALGIALAVAIGSVGATLADAPAAGVLLGFVAVPAGLYAAIASPRWGVPLAGAAALTGVGAIAYWGYAWLDAVRGS